MGKGERGHCWHGYVIQKRKERRRADFSYREGKGGSAPLPTKGKEGKRGTDSPFAVGVLEGGREKFFNRGISLPGDPHISRGGKLEYSPGERGETIDRRGLEAKLHSFSFSGKESAPDIPEGKRLVRVSFHSIRRQGEREMDARFHT